MTAELHNDTHGTLPSVAPLGECYHPLVSRRQCDNLALSIACFAYGERPVNGCKAVCS
jgi:hypothetical protein